MTKKTPELTSEARLTRMQELLDRVKAGEELTPAEIVEVVAFMEDIVHAMQPVILELQHVLTAAAREIIKWWDSLDASTKQALGEVASKPLADRRAFLQSNQLSDLGAVNADIRVNVQPGLVINDASAMNKTMKWLADG